MLASSVLFLLLILSFFLFRFFFYYCYSDGEVTLEFPHETVKTDSFHHLAPGDLTIV